MSQRWRTVGNTVFDLTGPRFEPSAPAMNALPLDRLAASAKSYLNLYSRIKTQRIYLTYLHSKLASLIYILEAQKFISCCFVCIDTEQLNLTYVFTNTEPGKKLLAC